MSHLPIWKPEEEQWIRERAYQLWEKRGCRDGYDLGDWLEAEAEMESSILG